MHTAWLRAPAADMHCIAVSNADSCIPSGNLRIACCTEPYSEVQGAHLHKTLQQGARCPFAQHPIARCKLPFSTEHSLRTHLSYINMLKCSLCPESKHMLVRQRTGTLSEHTVCGQMTQYRYVWK